jgi:hypothetical protein
LQYRGLERKVLPDLSSRKPEFLDWCIDFQSIVHFEGELDPEIIRGTDYYAFVLQALEVIS